MCSNFVTSSHKQQTFRYCSFSSFIGFTKSDNSDTVTQGAFSEPHHFQLVLWRWLCHGSYLNPRKRKQVAYDTRAAGLLEVWTKVEMSDLKILVQTTLSSRQSPDFSFFVCVTREGKESMLWDVSEHVHAANQRRPEELRNESWGKSVTWRGVTHARSRDQARSASGRCDLHAGHRVLSFLALQAARPESLWLSSEEKAKESGESDLDRPKISRTPAWAREGCQLRAKYGFGCRTACAQPEFFSF